MVKRPVDLSLGSAMVVTNPEEDRSSEAFHALLDDLARDPDPELDSIGGAEAVPTLRVDTEA